MPYGSIRSCPQAEHQDSTTGSLSSWMLVPPDHLAPTLCPLTLGTTSLTSFPMGFDSQIAHISEIMWLVSLCDLLCLA